MTDLIRTPLGYSAWLCFCTLACLVIFWALGAA